MWYLLTCEYLKAHMHLKSLGVSQYTGLAGGAGGTAQIGGVHAGENNHNVRNIIRKSVRQ